MVGSCPHLVLVPQNVGDLVTLWDLCSRQDGAIPTMACGHLRSMVVDGFVSDRWCFRDSWQQEVQWSETMLQVSHDYIVNVGVSKNGIFRPRQWFLMSGWNLRMQQIPGFLHLPWTNTVSVGTAHAYISCHDCCKTMQNLFISENRVQFIQWREFIGRNMRVLVGVTYKYIYIYILYTW